VPRPVAVLSRAYPAGARTGWHRHARAQLLHASTGLTLVNAADGTWVLPAEHALFIPPCLDHDVTMHGLVAMCSAYIAPEALAAPLFGPISGCRVLEVSGLLAAALTALAEEPVLYDEAGRGGHLAALILDEIARAPETPLTLPLPRDPRLRRVCAALMADPGAERDLDAWADQAGASRRTLTRGFRAETGLSFGAGRTRARVLRALALEADGQAPRAVARAVGYADPRGLGLAMRRALAAPP